MDVFTTSYLRANIVAWLPIEKGDRVLYIGQEDVIAEKLREMSGDVTVRALGSDFREAVYDYIICIGERMTVETAAAFRQQLSEKGRMIFAAENTYGMKYLAGAKEEGSGTYFAALEGQETSLGYTREELTALFDAAGFLCQEVYYPFPDYHFAMSIYSDDYLPKQGELIDQIGNFDQERLVLFDEAKAMDTVIAQEKFQEFSNSYLIAAGIRQESVRNDCGEKIAFVKFSNDRGKAHNIKTYITKSKDNQKHLLKAADSEEASEQITNMKKTYLALQDLYRDSRFLINAYREREHGAELEFLEGYTMEEELDRLLESGRKEEAAEKMLEVFSEMRKCRGMQEFQMTEEFREVFGEPKLPEGLSAAAVNDIDMIMPNILLKEQEDTWTVIDYEWSFHFPVPMNYIVYRAIHYYADTTAKRRVLNAEELYERAGISPQELKAYEQMEASFQSYVLKGHVPARQLYREFGKPAYHISSVLNVIDEMERRRALQVYFDRGKGFSEADSVYYHSKALDGTYSLEIPVEQDVTGLRIDPGSQACTVEIEELFWKQEKASVIDFVSNGHKMEGNSYLFDTEDPNLLITGIPSANRILVLKMRIDSMSLAAAEWIAPKIDAKYRLKKMLKK